MLTSWPHGAVLNVVTCALFEEEADVIRVTRLSGVTAREAEEQVAQYVEEEVARYDGRNLGARTRRDGSGGLRVDFTYDAATPPVAMEITALVEPDVRALGTDLRDSPLIRWRGSDGSFVGL